jgi:hypothetical protein
MKVNIPMITQNIIQAKMMINVAPIICKNEYQQNDKNKISSSVLEV